MLSLEIERALREAWLKVKKEILSDSDELYRRLARRGSKSLTRPPRAWCIAIRASDRRITLAHWLITPEHAMDLNHPAHPYEPIEHEVTIQTHAIRRYCHPVRIAFPGEEVDEVARRLGVHFCSLRNARRSGMFNERYYKGLGGKRGNPVPVIYTSELLDRNQKGPDRPGFENELQRNLLARAANEAAQGRKWSLGLRFASDGREMN